MNMPDKKDVPLWTPAVKTALCEACLQAFPGSIYAQDLERSLAQHDERQLSDGRRYDVTCLTYEGEGSNQLRSGRNSG